MNLADMALSHGLSVNEILSGVFGSISLTAWICLLVRVLGAKENSPYIISCYEYFTNYAIASSAYRQLQSPECRRPIHDFPSCLALWRSRESIRYVHLYHFCQYPKILGLYLPIVSLQPNAEARAELTVVSNL